VKGFYLRFTTGVIAQFDATVAYLAEALKALGTPTARTFAGARRV